MSLDLACQGKTASQGGLNVGDLKKMARDQDIAGYSTMTRSQVLAALCGGRVSGVATKATSKKRRAPVARARATVQQQQQHEIFVPETSPYLSGQKMRHVNRAQLKEWGKRKASTVEQRRSLVGRCGKKAYLYAEDELKYPVMSGDCKLDCVGLASSLKRAQMVYNGSRAGPAAKAKALTAWRAGQRFIPKCNKYYNYPTTQLGGGRGCNKRR